MLKNFRQIDKHLYRSGALYHLDEIDIRKIRECGIECVVDLRTAQEVQEKPDTSIDGVEYIHIPIFNEAALGITKETGSDPAEALKKIKDKKKMRSMIPRMPELYAGMVSDPGIRTNLAKALRLILNNISQGKTTLFHCTVGKDRAGLTAALVLHILGRTDDQILKDYLKTNRSVRSQANKYWFMVFVFRQDPIAASLVRKAYTVEKGFLMSAYSKMDELFGGIDGFIRDGLGIDPVKELERQL